MVRSAQNQDNTQPGQHANQGEEKHAGVSERPDDGSRDRPHQEERDVGEDGIDAQRGAAILDRDSLDRFDAYLDKLGGSR